MGSLNYKEKLPDENEKIEYKASFNKLSDDIWETISAFENTSGGILVLGILEKDSSGNTINDLISKNILEKVGPCYKICN